MEPRDRPRDRVYAPHKDFRIEPERVIDAADHVVVIETRRGRGHGGGVEVEHRSAVIWALPGKVRSFPDPEEALKTVGLRE